MNAWPEVARDAGGSHIFGDRSPANGAPSKFALSKVTTANDFLKPSDGPARRQFTGVFLPSRRLSEEEVGFFVNVDFIKHVALVASVNENMRQPIVGGGRYVVATPTQAEVAFAVVDEYQGQGIGAALNAPSHRDCAKSRAQGIHCGSFAGKHADVESFQK